MDHIAVNSRPARASLAGLHSGRGVVDPSVARGAGYLLAADVGGTRLRLLLARADGTPAGWWNTHLPNDGKSPASVVHLMQRGLRAMLDTVPAAPLLHVTAGAPGITDAEQGTVLAAPNLPGWTAVPLAALLENSFQVPAAVDNDTNLAALGERAAGAARGVDDFVFIAMGTGVGAGIVLGGQVHRGRNGSAGEIGYLPVNGMRRQSLRGSETGQLEQSIGGLGIEARWRSLLRDAGRDEHDPLYALRAPEVFDRAATGDEIAGEVLRWTADLLGDAVIALALVLDPALVVLGGGVGSHPALCAAASAVLRGSDYPLPAIVPSALGPAAQLHGAVAVSLAAMDAAHRC